MRRLHCLVQLIALLFCSVPLSASAQAGRSAAPIDPLVLDELASTGDATFWVVFREKADLSPAFEIRDWQQRGRFVYDRLVEVAERSQAGVRTLLSARSVEARPFWIANTIRVTTADPGLLPVLAARPEVSKIIASPKVGVVELTPGNEQPPERNIEWNIEHIRAPLVWDTYGVQGEGVVIAHMDGGVQYDHPALVEQYRGNLGGGVFDHNYNWYDPLGLCDNPPNVPCDTGFHGTATIGFAVGDDGGTNQIGVAPEARFISAAVIWTTQNVLDAGQWFLAPTDLNGENPRPDLRPHIINNSWWWSGGNPVFEPMVQAWLASGIFPTAMVGNEGPACSSVTSLGDYPGVYAVGGFGINNDIWINSSRGPSSFGPIKPNITAPGADMRTCCPVDSYMTGSGTSASAPHVSGTVALMWSLNPELIGDLETTRRHLDHTAIDTSDLSCGGEPGNNNVWGEGRLDAFDAVSLVLVDGFESGDASVWTAVVPWAVE